MMGSTMTAMGGVKLASYEPLLELAAGGMATVYIARHRAAAGFERLVVIKRVHPHLLGNREFCDMFRDEAHVCSAIRSPHVVPVIDVVEADGELFLVLEYVESLPLSTLLSAARLEPAVVSRIFVDALAGLHAAHEAKDLHGAALDVIHRDVSPQNIIVGADGSSRLIDFGIAKAASRISVTNTGVMKGKVRYMSPEQVRQQPLDRRSDVFAAGVALFEALTGRPAFAGEDEGDIALALLLGELPPPSSLAPGLPPALDEVVAKALARDRADRYATAAELQEALEQALPPAAARTVARAVASAAGTTFTDRHAAIEAAMARRPPTARLWRVGIAVGAACVIAAAVTSAALLHDRSAAAAAAASASASAAPNDSAPPVTSAASATPPLLPSLPMAPRRAPSPAKPELRRNNPYGRP